MARPPASQGLILDIEDDDDTDLFLSDPEGNA